MRTEWLQLDFDRLIDALDEGRIDLVAAGMFVTEERSRRVRFSQPSLRVLPGWLLPASAGIVGGRAVRACGADPLTGRGGFPSTYAEAVDRVGLRLAALEGSVEAQRLRALWLPSTRWRGSLR